MYAGFETELLSDEFGTITLSAENLKAHTRADALPSDVFFYIKAGFSINLKDRSYEICGNGLDVYGIWNAFFRASVSGRPSVINIQGLTSIEFTPRGGFFLLRVKYNNRSFNEASVSRDAICRWVADSLIGMGNIISTSAELEGSLPPAVATYIDTLLPLVAFEEIERLLDSIGSESLSLSGPDKGIVN